MVVLGGEAVSYGRGTPVALMLALTWSIRTCQLLRRNVKRFRGGLVCKAHRLLYHSTLGLRVKEEEEEEAVPEPLFQRFF